MGGMAFVGVMARAVTTWKQADGDALSSVQSKASKTRRRDNKAMCLRRKWRHRLRASLYKMASIFCRAGDEENENGDIRKAGGHGLSLREKWLMATSAGGGAFGGSV